MNTNKENPIKSVFVLGSTSEVAKCICIDLAKQGCKRFHLIARNDKTNNEFAGEIINNYSANVTTETYDLLEAHKSSAKKYFDIGDFDLYLITAGNLGDANLARSDFKEALRITTSNFTGLIPWITSIATKERLAKPFRLWVFSSVAADRGRPSNYHYGAAKAGLTKFCEGLLLRSYKKLFLVRIIKAGYIATRMSYGKAPQILCIDPKLVSRILLRNPNKQGIEYLPFWWSPLMFIIRRIPALFASKI